MASPATQRPVRTETTWWRTLRGDPIFGVTLAVFLAVAALYLAAALKRALGLECAALGAEPLAFLSRRLGPFVFLSLVLVALRFRHAHLRDREERGFWNDLSLAIGCWWTAAAAILFFPTTVKPFAVDFATSVLYALYYVALLMAVERQPHRRHRWRPIELERRLSWPTAIAVILGFFLYFPFLAVRFAPEVYATGIPDLCLFLVLDGYLSLRLVYLFRATRSRRWRPVYALLALATLAVFGNDVAEAAALGSQEELWHWDAASNVLLYLPYLFFVAAARLRHHPFPWEPPPPASRIRLEDNLPGPLGQTMTFVLLFPLAHFGGYEIGVLDESIRPHRELLVLAWLPILGIVALVQYRLLQRNVARLGEERQRSERALHRAQKELRLAQERQHTEEVVRASDERFAKAFRACPDVMAITRVADGRIVEVNDSCLRVLGYEPQELVGHTTAERGIWTSWRERNEVLAELRRHGQMTLEVAFRRKSGEERIGLFSARMIEIDGEPHVFSITRDVTETHHREQWLERRTAALERASSASWALDADGRVVFWNEAARRCFGWSAAEVEGAAATEILTGIERADGAFHGEIRASGGGTLRVEGLEIPSADTGDRRRLVICRTV